MAFTEAREVYKFLVLILSRLSPVLKGFRLVYSEENTRFKLGFYEVVVPQKDPHLASPSASAHKLRAQIFTLWGHTNVIATNKKQPLSQHNERGRFASECPYLEAGDKMSRVVKRR
jgi:hypothetical protein